MSEHFEQSIGREFAELAALHLQNALRLEEAAIPGCRPTHQVAVSSFCLSIEYAAKCLVANDYFPALMKGLGPEARRKLAKGSSNYEKRAMFEYKDTKHQSFEEVLNYLSSIDREAVPPVPIKRLQLLRNASIHSLISRQGPSLEQAAMAALFYNILMEKRGFQYRGPCVSSDQKERLQKFKLDRQALLERVQEKLDKARKRNVRPGSFAPATRNGLESLLLDCPICDTPALVKGHLEVEPDFDVSDGEVWVAGVIYHLDPNAFDCPGCKLVLDSKDEMALGGLPIELLDYDAYLGDDERENFREELSARESDWDY